MNDTATLKLGGKVALDDFAKAIGGFIDLMDSLGKEVANGITIEWEVSGLERGSAITTIRGISNASGGDVAIERVVSAYYRVGEAVQSKRAIPFSATVRSAAGRITGILNGRVRSITFETHEGDAEILSPDSQPIVDAPISKPGLKQVSHGAIRGRVQSLTNRQSLRFTLYDLIHDGAVSCYLNEGSEDLMRNAWGRLVIVEGIVRRNQYTGHPTSVREIKKVHIIPETQGTWRDAVGAARGSLGGMLPEDAIRKVRDG